MTATKEDMMVRISYEQGESGWAEMLYTDSEVEKTGEQLYRIQNIPMSQSLNLHDVVTAEKVDGRLLVKEVVENEYGGKEVVEYPKEDKDATTRFWDKLKAEGIHAEGWLPGVLAVAFPLALKPVLLKLVAEFGYKIAE